MTAGALSPSSPPAERLEAWRAAVLAYRRVMQRDGDDWCGRVEAIEAYLAVRPGDSPDEAERQVTRAICWAAAHHTKWFWRGVRYRPRAPRTWQGRPPAAPRASAAPGAAPAASGP